MILGTEQKSFPAVNMCDPSRKGRNDPGVNLGRDQQIAPIRMDSKVQDPRGEVVFSVSESYAVPQSPDLMGGTADTLIPEFQLPQLSKS